MILVAAISGGAFGLQYTIMRRYAVENASLLSLFVATIVVPTIAVSFVLPGWTHAIAAAGIGTNSKIFLFGFGWGLGAITYAYAFNYLGMALAAALIKGLTIAIGAGVPLIRRWAEIPGDARTATLIGIAVLLVGTAISGKAGVMRENESGAPSRYRSKPDPRRSRATRLFVVGVFACLVSGVLSAFVNLGYDYGMPLEQSMQALSQQPLTWKATLIRWMPMYWGGIAALALCMGGVMINNGTWKNYFSPGSGRDFVVASSMGGVHFLAQIPYGIGAYYLGPKLGTSVGWGVNIGMALIVASAIGFINGEWKQASVCSTRTLLAGIGVLILAMMVLAYANSLVAPSSA